MVAAAMAMYLTLADLRECAEKYSNQSPKADARVILEHFSSQLPSLANDATDRHVRAMADTIQRQDAEIQRLRRELAGRWTLADLRVRAALLVAEEKLNPEEAGWLFEFLHRLEENNDSERR